MVASHEMQGTLLVWKSTDLSHLQQHKRILPQSQTRKVVSLGVCTSATSTPAPSAWQVPLGK